MVPTDHNTSQVDRVIFETSAVKVGALRCPVGHETFRNPGPTQNYVLVFPRTCVSVRRSDDVKFVADPTMVAFWNRNQDYSRQELSPEGAIADWFSIDQNIILDTARSLDPSVEDTPDRPLRLPYAHSAAGIYLLQRQLVRQVNSRSAQPLAIEEAVLEMLLQNLKNAYKQWGVSVAPTETCGRSLQEEIVYRAEEFIAKHFREPLFIAQIAKEAGSSPFHLCRLFRRFRKMALHARCNELRLRSALELVLDTRMDITEVSLSSGFSSHSHFTWAFRRQFGVTPSALRGSA